MNKIDSLDKANNFFIIVDKDMTIKSISKSLLDDFEFLREEFHSLFDFIKEVFLNNQFSNVKHVKKITDLVKKSIQCESYIKESFIIVNEKESDCFLKYNMEIEPIYLGLKLYIVRFTNFSRFDIANGFKNPYFEKFNDKFMDLIDVFDIGKFVIDCHTSKDQIYVDDCFIKLLDFKKSRGYKYYLSDQLSRKEDYIVPLRETFMKKYDQLLNSEIKKISEVFEMNDKVIQVSAIVMDRNSQGEPSIVGGVVEDITEYHNHDKINHLKSIYDLAITSGGIGVFYYDVDIYGKEYFEANQIYADLIGLDSNELGLYKISDFKKSLVKLEEDLSSDQDIKKSLQDLLTGHIDGTTDDIIKIKHLKNGKEKYLLSSSKIDERHDDGSPKNFGGYIIDITERIDSEKNKNFYAYTDEIAKLPNKRKLYKDMQKQTEGIGLFIDIDDFKKINDQYGHLMGDKVLSLIAEAISFVASKYDGVYSYRLYGDEFFIYLSKNNHQLVDTIKDEINKETSKKLEEVNIQLSFSFGHSLLEECLDTDQFVKKADYSMYKEKIYKKESIFKY